MEHNSVGDIISHHMEKTVGLAHSLGTNLRYDDVNVPRKLQYTNSMDPHFEMEKSRQESILFPSCPVEEDMQNFLCHAGQPSHKKLDADHQLFPSNPRTGRHTLPPILDWSHGT